LVVENQRLAFVAQSRSGTTREVVGVAIGIGVKLVGVTQEQFDAMDEVIGRDVPQGLIFHASGPV
jgi:hypothetical protein